MVTTSAAARHPKPPLGFASLDRTTSVALGGGEALGQAHRRQASVGGGIQVTLLAGSRRKANLPCTRRGHLCMRGTSSHSRKLTNSDLTRMYNCDLLVFKLLLAVFGWREPGVFLQNLFAEISPRSWTTTCVKNADVNGISW
jgi:hypothetical protein